MDSLYDTNEGTLLTYKREVLNWIRLKYQEGTTILRKERAFTDAQKCIDFINGEQLPLKSRAISSITDNKIRKIVFEIVSALTDVRPIWNYETHREEYKAQADILNKLARGWWKGAKADRKLQSALTYSCAAGSGYLQLQWNEQLPGGGDFELIPYDPRDVIPIDPTYTDSIQDWQGVILKQRLPESIVKDTWGPAAASVTGADGTWMGNDGKLNRLYDLISSSWGFVSGQRSESKSGNPGEVEVLRIFLKDKTLHTGSEPRVMGEPKSNWAYTVYPLGYIKPDGTPATEEDARIYPRGRLIVCAPNAIFYDGPNPNWHGLFPLIRITLDPLPWSLLGAALVGDLIPIQNALNEALRGAEDGIGQWVRRGVIADRGAISQGDLDAIDTRKAGMRALLNPAAGDGFTIVPGPDFPTWYMEILAFFKNEMDENSGVRGLQQMAQLKQMPSADTIEHFMEALSPMLKMRARGIEVSLGELAEMLKVGFFQYYTMARRVEILGKDGMSLEDFDYDPESLVPSNIPGDTREARASKHHKNFTFSVAPNSFLNVSHTTQKMIMLQLFRANGLDIWSLWDAMDIPNTGPAPAETIPERLVAARKLGLQPGPTPELVRAQEAASLAQAQAVITQLTQQMAMAASMGGGQLGAPPPEGGMKPPSIPNNNGVGSAGGRPPTGAEAPQMVMKDGGQRMAISESGR